MVYVWYKLLKKIIPSSPYSTFNSNLCKDVTLMLQYIVYVLLSGAVMSYGHIFNYIVE